jgi:hypothetical protein
MQFVPHREHRLVTEGPLTVEHKTTLFGQNINVSGTHAYHSAADTQILIIKFPLTHKTIYFTLSFSLVCLAEHLFVFSLPPAKRRAAPLLHNHLGSASAGWQGRARTSNNYHVDLFWQAVRCDPPHRSTLCVTLGCGDCPAVPYRANKHICWN